MTSNAKEDYTKTSVAGGVFAVRNYDPDRASKSMSNDRGLPS